VKVGDLVRYHNSIGIIVCVNSDATLVKWLDDIGEVEDVENYAGLSLEVISESR